MPLFSVFKYSLKRCFFYCSLVFCFTLFAQPLDWVAVNTVSSNGYGEDIAVDENGNVYAVGSFIDTIDLDPGVGIANLVSAGSRDIYIQKLSALGNFLWGKHITSTEILNINAIAIDEYGDIFTCGTFKGTVDFNPGPGINNLVGDELNFSSFIQKLDGNGNFQWAKIITGNGDIDALSLYANSDGEVFIVGYFLGLADFDPNAGVINLQSLGTGTDMFIQKLDASGNLLWAKRIGGYTGHTKANDLVLDDTGEIYITGEFNYTVDFDPGPGIVNLQPALNKATSFVLKLDSIGDYVWARALSSTEYNAGNTINVTDTHVYVGGHFNGFIDFDPSSNIVSLAYYSTRNGYIEKLDLNGGIIWAKGLKAPGSAKCEVKDLDFDEEGNIYILGDFKGDVDFNLHEDHELFKTSNGSYDVFIEKLNNSGEYIWMKQMGGAITDKAFALTVDSYDNIYSTGFFTHQVDFDLGSGVLNITAANGKDVFVHKMIQCESEETIYPVACLKYVSPSGNFAWTESGSYRDVMADTVFDGCYITYTIDLTVKHVNTVMHRVGDSFIADADNATYQWYHCEFNLLELPGETGQSFVVPQNDPYLVIVTQDGCSDTSDCVWVSNLAVMDLTGESIPTMYYNDNMEFIGFEMDHAIEGSLILRDLYGRILQSKTLNTDETHYLMDVSSYSSGVYLVDYQKDGQSLLTNKIIIR